MKFLFRALDDAVALLNVEFYLVFDVPHHSEQWDVFKTFI